MDKQNHLRLAFEAEGEEKEEKTGIEFESPQEEV